MKQKVSTRAIIKQDGKLLLLRRSGGRPSIQGLYELPGGRVHMNQQPEDAIRHALRIHADVATETVQLHDVLSFVDPDDRELQYVFIVYEVSLQPTDRTVELSGEYDKYVWKKLAEIDRSELTQSTMQLLGLQDVPYAVSTPQTIAMSSSESTTPATLSSAIIYSDGGSRGNPGPSSSGFVILNDAGEVVAEGGAYLGVTTNNVAEYQAVYLGLERAQEMGVRTVDFRMDSLLVVNQMNGLWKIKHPDLSIIHHRIKELAGTFDKVTFSHVRREYNKLADGMVNKILDEHEA